MGPLKGMRIIELAGMGPGPFAAMMLADHGAEIIRIERDGRLALPNDPIERGRTTLKLDLRDEAERELLLRLVETADALVDPYRPGRIEALGLGPAELHARNPRLVIGRITGWGQRGPLSQRAGHDIDYLALSGLLSATGSEERPIPPLNLVADYGGGAMMLVFGMLAALLEVKGGAEKGRVVDAAMSEGAALLGTIAFAMRNIGMWTGGREGNLLDGGMALYGTYRCSDGLWLAVGALEPQFAGQFLKALGLGDDPLFAQPLDRARWEEQRETIAEKIAAEPRSHWLEVFEGRDACVAPVLKLKEAPRDPHHVARGSFVRTPDGAVPAPAPRYGDEALPPARTERDAARKLLEDFGCDEALIEKATRA
ncbi:CaiB/BaiF CoA transferase family protein [Sphingomicrobium aestuariivivum]|uniref:CaiB/BaiF CoA transferase family protein n=1 Tax=Sphingomicrobium aestuariivivum TaxID=1582356 RepID=UPI001FD6BC6E|nr:CaiB/BaiF CoA-transferase family protein [Sphingomicrobium aestuariivivum]MCJ8191984.1 CoA transferase [Sphingomicrobium aestuariivivum]